MRKLSYVFYLLLAAVLFGGCNYSEETLFEYNAMTKPITLHEKDKLTFWYGVTLKDGNGELHKFGNLSSVANHIGKHYAIGDTLAK